MQKGVVKKDVSARRDEIAYDYEYDSKELKNKTSLTKIGIYTTLKSGI